MIESITPRELHARLAAREAVRLIDVREPWEHALARIPGSEIKPLGEVRTWARELDPEGDYVIYCHSGARSYQVCVLLQQMGIARVKNLEGGIDAWSLEVDATVPRY